MPPIKVRFYCNDHGYITAGFDSPIEHVAFNQRGELGLWCPLCHKARPMLLEQFSGMLDRKGHEIYAGDIVKYKVGTLWVEGEVFYDAEWAVWFKGNNQNLSSYRKTTEIIGNKHATITQ